VIPVHPSRFGELRALTCRELARLGCRRWDESGLMLFPVSWFDSVPRGFEVETITGAVLPFDPDTCSRDQRYGVLAFGVRGVP
jgi:hypothetical protein